MAGDSYFQTEHAEKAIPCRECLAGRCRLRYKTYFTWLEGELVMAPNFPVWVCDVCSWQIFDADSLNWLRTLLNPPSRRARPDPAQRWTGEDLQDDLARPVSG